MRVRVALLVAVLSVIGTAIAASPASALPSYVSSYTYGYCTIYIQHPAIVNNVTAVAGAGFVSCGNGQGVTITIQTCVSAITDNTCYGNTYTLWPGDNQVIKYGAAQYASPGQYYATRIKSPYFPAMTTPLYQLHGAIPYLYW